MPFYETPGSRKEQFLNYPAVSENNFDMQKERI
jgi:hypothetical protein